MRYLNAVEMHGETVAHLEGRKRNVGVEFRGILGFLFGSIICSYQEIIQHGAWCPRLVKRRNFLSPKLLIPCTYNYLAFEYLNLAGQRFLEVVLE